MANPQNTRRISETLAGEEIAKLNEVSPGLGNKLHRLLSTFGSSLAAQAGHKGPVGVVKQKTKNPQGIIDPALTLQQDRIAGVDDPLDDLDAVNLRTLRRLMLELEEDAEIPLDPLKQVCRPIALSNQKTIESGCDITYAVEVLGEFVYLAGELATVPVFRVFRLGIGNEFVLVGTLAPSEAFQRMVLHGHYIFGCRTGGGSTNLTVIDIKKPEAPDEVAVFGIGAAGRGLHAQGSHVHVACDGSIKVVDISIPSAPLVVATI